VPKNFNNWLNDVIQHSLKRNKFNGKRDRKIYSLRNSIIESKYKKLNPIIAEYKTRSPSGFISDRDYKEYVKFLENYVAGFSVLTEEKYFNGSYEVLNNIAKLTSKPILMKDFVVTFDQIESAYNLGADVVLLIASIISEKELENLINEIKNYGMESLVEIHDQNELEVVINYNPSFVGVNSRNLFNLSIDLNNAVKLIEKIPKNFIKIAESGLKNRNDIDIFKSHGADAFLIGSSLMKDPHLIISLI